MIENGCGHNDVRGCNISNLFDHVLYVLFDHVAVIPENRSRIISYTK